MSRPLAPRHAKKSAVGVYTIRKKTLLLLLVLFAIGIFCGYRAFVPPKAVMPTQIGALTVHTDFLPEDYAGYSGINRRIRYIVIHETDNYSSTATAKAHNSFLHSEKQKDTALSWHYTVDENEIYHHLPDDIAAFHASDGMKNKGGNQAGVAIELCVNQGSDFNKTVDNSAQLTAYLLKSYKLDLDDVKQHYDFCGKDCPDRLRENTNWDEFLLLVQKYLKNY